jgi:ferredoxin
VKGEYVGLHSCAAATVTTCGTKACPYGCVGFGDCVQECRFGAIRIGPNHMPVIDMDKCTGCGACAKVCPHRLLVTVAVGSTAAIPLCGNRTENKTSVLKNCKVGCIKCGKCEKVCPNGALVLDKGLPKIDAAKCTGCGECVKGCPTHVLALGADLLGGVHRAAV